MKYIAFIVGITLIVLIGAFVWNVVSDSFSGIGISVPNSTTVSPSGNGDSSTSGVSGPSSSNGGSQSSDTSQGDTPTSAISDREGVVTLSSPRRSISSNRPQEITLRANLKEGETVNITGWRIRTNEERATIPQAIHFYNVSESNQETDIILQRGDTVKIYFGDSPISDSIRLNKCTGFLNEKYDLNTFFPERCPRIDKSMYRHLSGDCQDYITRINGRCEIPDSEALNSFPGSEEGNECRRFLADHFNIGYCYRTHDDDPDFLDDEWRVWIDDEPRIFDPDHDWVRLYNTSGVLIDDYDY